MQTARHWSTCGILITEWLFGYPHLTHCTRQRGETPINPPGRATSTGATPRGTPPLDTGFQPPTELLRPAGPLGLLPHHCQHTILQHLLPGLTHSNWSYTRAIVEADEATQHQRPVSHPWRESIDHPVPKFPKNMP